MPTPTKGTRFGGSPAHQRLMLANMASSLFEHGRITTTEAQRLFPIGSYRIPLWPSCGALASLEELREWETPN